MDEPIQIHEDDDTGLFSATNESKKNLINDSNSQPTIEWSYSELLPDFQNSQKNQKFKSILIHNIPSTGSKNDGQKNGNLTTGSEQKLKKP